MPANGNARLLANERRYLAAAMQRTSDPTFGPVIVRGMGSRVWDAEGRDYFDLTCGYSAANFGHAFQPLVQAAIAQLGQLTHLTGVPHPGRAELAERLVRTCGRNDRDQVLLNTSGSRAIESAWKAAVSFRPGKIVSLSPSFHGRSLSTSALSDTPRVTALQPLDQFAVRRPASEFAYCAICPLELSYPGCDIACQHSLLKWLEGEAEHISAIVVEPALGARGYIFPPAEYWQRIREVTDRHSILMIADEIQMGLGRCGGWLLSRLQNWQPDLVVLGKSLGGGITPISAVVGRSDVLDALPPGSESETFAASPLATAVACEVIDQLEKGRWFERAGRIGASLREALSRTAPASGRDYPPVRIETCGASAAVEFVSRSIDLPQAAAEARRFAQSLLHNAGLLTHYSGPYGTRVVLLPPLTTSDDELAEIATRCQCA